LLRGKPTSLFPEPVEVPTILDRPSPYIAGVFTACPKGFLLHSSRSGLARSEYDEFLSTAAYCQSNPAGLAWHASIGPQVVAVHLSPRQWGWNARSPASYEWIASEFAQGRLDDPIGDEQIDAFCWYALHEVRPVWPDIPLVLIHHSQTVSGQRDGKSDIYPIDDPELAAFNERILSRLQPNW